MSYESLTPTELDSDKAGCYISALNYAYEHPDIRNIAVTGPYGAGKSSVLKRKRPILYGCIIAVGVMHVSV